MESISHSLGGGGLALAGPPRGLREIQIADTDSEVTSSTVAASRVWLVPYLYLRPEACGLSFLLHGCLAESFVAEADSISAAPPHLRPPTFPGTVQYRDGNPVTQEIRACLPRGYPPNGCN